MDCIIENNICLAKSCVNNDIAGIKKSLSNGANINTRCGKIFEIIIKSDLPYAYRGLNFLFKYCNKKNITINFNNIYRILNEICPPSLPYYTKKMDQDFLKKIIVLHNNNVVNIKKYQFDLLNLNIKTIKHLIKKYNLYIHCQSQTIDYVCKNMSLDKVVFFVNEMNFNFDYKDAFYSAFIGSNLDIVEYFVSQGQSYKENLDYIIEEVLKNDSIESLEYIFKYNSIVIKEEFFNICCHHESDLCMAYLKSFNSVEQKKLTIKD